MNELGNELVREPVREGADAADSLAVALDRSGARRSVYTVGDITITTSYPVTDHMNFGEAIKAMRNGRKVSRTGWNGKGMWVKIQNPDENSKMTEPYIYMKTAESGKIPWVASQSDMMANDWTIFD